MTAPVDREEKRNKKYDDEKIVEVSRMPQELIKFIPGVLNA